MDNFNRYRVYLLFLALFCLSFPAFIAFPIFGILIIIRLYMGAVYSVCGSATMTLAGDVLPPSKITEGISRFAFTVSIGMAVGPYVGLQVQNYLDSKESNFLSQHMEHEVYTLQADATVRDAISFFSDKHISAAPIVSSSGFVAGFISDGDIMRYLRTEDHQPAVVDSSASFMDYFWNPDVEFEQKLDSIMDRNVLEIGTHKPITIPISASLEDICKLLSEKGVKKIPVVSDEHIVGILLRSSIMHYLAKRYLTRNQIPASM